MLIRFGIDEDVSHKRLVPTLLRMELLMKEGTNSSDGLSVNDEEQPSDTDTDTDDVDVEGYQCTVVEDDSC